MRNRSISPIQGLQLVFLHLKLSGAIDWSWWFVMAPTIIDFAWYVFMHTSTGEQFIKWLDR